MHRQACREVAESVSLLQSWGFGWHWRLASASPGHWRDAGATHGRFGLSGRLGKDSGVCRLRLPNLAAMVDGHLLGRGDLVIEGAAPWRRPARANHPGRWRATNNQNLTRAGRRPSSRPLSFTPPGLPAIQVARRPSRVCRRSSPFSSPAAAAAALGVSPLAVVSPTARLAEDVDVHPLATIGDDVTIGAGTTIHSGVHIMAGSQIGEDVTIFPNAVLYENTVVGPRCLIHAGAVLGAYGFGYELVDGRHRLSAQLGNVVLGADVEIGAGTTIDRGTYGPTVIGEGTKIDDLVMVAHNCRIGRHNMLCSQVGIAGSTTTGDYVVMAGQVGVRDHVHIGDGAVSGPWPASSTTCPTAAA